MNTMVNEGAVAPEVQEFLAAVRDQLADLDPDELRDITEGLEADLTDLVAERGRGALGDPVAYARELRAAAGLDPVAARPGRTVPASATAFLDACHARFDALVERLPWNAAPLLAWLQPLWWICRGWLAVQLVYWVGLGYTSTFALVPDLQGFGWLLLPVAVALSVQVGRGRLWPGGRRGLLTRLVLLALNVFAVAVALPTIDRMQGDDRFWEGYQVGMDEALNQPYGEDGLTPLDDQAGVYSSGKWVSNIYPYDAQGRALVGVQLFDQAGRPIKVVTQPDCEPSSTETRPQAETDENGWMGYCADQGHEAVLPRVFYPWSNGAAQLFNVFPLPSRVQAEPEPSATAFAEKDRPAIGQYPLAVVPPASLPGIKPGVQDSAVQE